MAQTKEKYKVAATLFCTLALSGAWMASPNALVTPRTAMVGSVCSAGGR